MRIERPTRRASGSLHLNSSAEPLMIEEAVRRAAVTRDDPIKERQMISCLPSAISGAPGGPSFHVPSIVSATLLLLSLPLSLHAEHRPGAVDPAAQRADCNVPAIVSGEAEPPEYYSFALVSTNRVRGTARGGRATLYFEPSPFGMVLAPDGSYRHCVRVTVPGLPSPPAGSEFVAWLATPTLELRSRIGTLDGDGAVAGYSEWNKFLVVVTVEPSRAENSTLAAAGSSETWTGPIVLRGVARSGMMHSMLGHDPFNPEEDRRNMDFQ